MAFVQITTAPGLTADQYDAIMQAAHGGELSDGEMFHVAGASNETWYVIDGWDSREQCQQSMSKLMPAFAQSGVDPSSFEVREFEIHKLMARQAR
jgi:hypothetical protein